MSGERRLSNPQLEQLHAMRSQLDAGQLDSLQALETLQTRLQTNQTNIELFHINPSLALASPLRSARETLERKASFLMASPIVGHIYKSVGGLVQATTLALPAPARSLLTSQIAGVRQVLAYNNAHAIAEARSGKRFCPLSLRTEAFGVFLEQHEPQLRELIGACGQDGPARTAELSATLLSVASDYLQRARLVPRGLPAGRSFVFDGHRFGNAPLSLRLLARPHSSSTFSDAVDGQCVAILIGLDDLDKAQVDPARGSLTSQMHVQGFERCAPPQRQAAVFLEKLFLELAHVEEKIYLGRRVSKDGSALTECARATRRERDYEGSVLIGDSLVAVDTNGPHAKGRGQRKLASETIAVVAEIAGVYRQNHGEPIVMDPELEAWLVGPATYRDMTALEQPASRLQLATMPEIAQQLLRTRAFASAAEPVRDRHDAELGAAGAVSSSAADNAAMTGAVIAAVTDAVTDAVIADPVESLRPGVPAPPA